MAGLSKNVDFDAFGAWIQEEYDRLFKGEIPIINVITGYIVNQPLSALTEVGGSR